MRPIDANDDLRPRQISARSSGVSAARTSNDPHSPQIRSTTAESSATCTAGPSSSTISTAPAPAG